MMNTPACSGTWRYTLKLARSYRARVACAKCVGPGGGRGKRGGSRVIYFHVASRDQIRLLLIYRKGVKDDLSAAEKKILRKLNEDW